MTHESMTQSLWRASTSMPPAIPLSGDVDCDICVVGAGIAGLTSAYLLAAQGLRVIVLDARQAGAGETGNTTAHIAIPDELFSDLESSHGEDVARSAYQAFVAAADQIEAIVRDERIECQFMRVNGYLVSRALDPAACLDREYAAARRAGVAVMREEGLPVLGDLFGPALRFVNQAQFHPLRYLSGLVRALEARGVPVYCQSRVLQVEERAAGVEVTTTMGTVTASAAVVATNTPINDRVTMHTKQNAYQTYAVAVRVEKGVLPRVLIWDDDDPYHYFRLADAEDGLHDLLIVGGEDHKTGQSAEPQMHFAALESWLRERFPDAGPLAYRWSGQVMEPLDGLPYLGRNPGNRNVYIITGDSGNGMTHGTLGAMLVRDLIMQRQSRLADLYDPSRKPMRQAFEFLKEQANIAKQYTDWVRPGDADDAESIAPGDGAIVRTGLTKVAVYRDDTNVLHARSAVCPHLGCIVQWNAAEKTWDCPCHGSRFSAVGEVLHGPAVSDLAAVDDEEFPRGRGEHGTGNVDAPARPRGDA